ncbi:hypothetical protein K0M31_003800 [Melipona bicolor]|uniref:Uncharacterized protein n=1 Tax=Melipona bicolor TaxID=60889 RepID=A0AA40FY11_9HYME|nr:hypothetical protein K0M31_003800 [Melipona bicolor]
MRSSAISVNPINDQSCSPSDNSLLKTLVPPRSRAQQRKLIQTNDSSPNRQLITQTRTGIQHQPGLGTNERGGLHANCNACPSFFRLAHTSLLPNNSFQLLRVSQRPEDIELQRVTEHAERRKQLFSVASRSRT